jgi:hypothetical protein
MSWLFLPADDSFSSVTENYCSSLLEKHTPVGIDLPHECNKFASFKATLQRRNSEREDANIAFAGMNPHEALEAMRARDHGRPHTAKIQRRLTNPKKSETTWF